MHAAHSGQVGSSGWTDVEGRLRARGGVARWSELVGSPRDGAHLAAAVSAGTVLRVSRGTYALSGVDPAVVTAHVHRARLGCASAAHFLRLDVLTPPTTPHLSVPRSRGATPSAARDHHPARLHREDLGAGRGDERWPVVTLPQALARMLLCQPADHALVTIDSALARGLVTPGDIRAALPARAPVHARMTLARADGRAQSPIETIARLALRAAGFQVEPAHHVDGVGYVDLLVEGCVVVELDGFAYHSRRGEYRTDRRRDRALVALGLTVLRFTYEDVVSAPGRLAADVRATLTRRSVGR